LACRHHGVHPLTGLWEDIADLDGLHAFADYGLQLGFRGQVVIHPSHVAAVNQVFTPAEEDVEYYEAMVRAIEDAARLGEGAVRFRGQHIDLAHAEKARLFLQHAYAIRQQDEAGGMTR
jgi:citrate lyase subunit beta/citryl-CoA lyase